ncbi:Spherulation-specific family 4 [Trametes punicea]|nr:Spherulation-specific family 4 [Trametes punicea]
MFIPRALVAAAATLSSGVLIPLYIDPSPAPDCSTWAPLLDSISAHPSVPFWIVINPDSGPEGTPGSQPPTGYQECIPVLRAPNVVVLGYVHTSDGEASRQAGVTQDVDTYAGWDAAYRPDGIFFDEVSGEESDFATYQGFTSHARPLFNGGDGFIALNPGTAVDDDDYYSLADILLTAEDFFDQFSASELSLGPSTPASKQAVVLTDGPSSPPTSLISQLITTDHLKAFYVTTDSQAGGADPYNELPTDLESFIAAIEAAHVSREVWNYHAFGDVS